MTDAPSPADRITISAAAKLLSPDADPFLGRHIIKSRASRGLLRVWAATFEEVSPKDHSALVEAAHDQALRDTNGDRLGAAIIMSEWKLPPDAEWQVVADRDYALPNKFWAALPIEDAVWTTDAFLGRLADFDGFEQNLIGIFLRTSDVMALPGLHVSTVQVPNVDQAGMASSDPYTPSKTSRISPKQWAAWVAQYKIDHNPLPDVGRVIYPAAKAEFGTAVTQVMCRSAFTGNKPGPRSKV